MLGTRTSEVPEIQGIIKSLTTGIAAIYAQK